MGAAQSAPEEAPTNSAQVATALAEESFEQSSISSVEMERMLSEFERLVARQESKIQTLEQQIVTLQQEKTALLQSKKKYKQFSQKILSSKQQ